jgi:hypothetical protein
MIATDKHFKWSDGDFSSESKNAENDNLAICVQIFTSC